MPRKESGAQDRKRQAQCEVSLNESRKFMKKYFTSSGNAERQSAYTRRQDESADTDSQKILKDRGAKFSFVPGHKIPSLRHWQSNRLVLGMYSFTPFSYFCEISAAECAW